MTSILSFLSACFLTLILFQDFKQRLISWYSVGGLFLIAMLIGLHDNSSVTAFFKSSLTNFFLIALQMILVSIYFWIRRKKISRIDDVLIGKGDLIMLAILCLMFSTINLIAVYLFALFVSLLLSLPVFLRKKNSKTFQVPLAAYFALILIPLFIYKSFNPDFSFYNDIYMQQILLSWKL